MLFILFQIIVHKYYNDKEVNHDIALLKLKNKIVFKRNNVIAPICLYNNPYDYLAGLNATTVGWGKLRHGK